MHEFGPLESSEECAQMLLAPGAPIAQTPRRSTDDSPIRNSATMIVWDVPSTISGIFTAMLAPITPRTQFFRHSLR